MTYHLKREVVGEVINISLGMPEADAYLKFVRNRCRLNTVLSYGYDLQVFLNSIEKPVLEVTPLDILTFIESQQSVHNRQGRTNGLSIKGPRLSNRTIKRRLAAVTGFYEYLSVYHDLPLKTSPIPRGLVRRKTSWGNWYSRPTTTPLIREPETLPRPLDPEEISPFIDSMRCHRDKAMILLMLLTGLRKSEVLQLALEDIDFGQFFFPSILGQSLGNVTLLALIVCFLGVGIGVISPPANNACIELMPERVATISGLRAMFRQAGGAVSLTVATLLLHRLSLAQGFAIIFGGLALLVLATEITIFAMPSSPSSKAIPQSVSKR